MGALLARIGRDESGEMPAVVTADGTRASGSLRTTQTEKLHRGLATVRSSYYVLVNYSRKRFRQGGLRALQAPSFSKALLDSN
jgi:hypothetical protein